MEIIYDLLRHMAKVFGILKKRKVTGSETMQYHYVRILTLCYINRL